MPVLRRAHEAEREGPVGRPEMALPVVRRQRHAFQRRGGQGARGLCRLAALARDAGRYAGARPNLQAEGRPLLADMADAGGGGRGLPRRLRRRHLDRARLRGAHSLQRRHVLSWHLARAETTAAWRSLLSRIAPPDMVVTDGGSGFASAVAAEWPRTRVQRCVFHAFCQVKRHTTSRPKLQAGVELYALARELLHVETLQQADWWVERFMQWCEFWSDFLEQKSLVEGRMAYTHRRLREARSGLVRLVNAGMLFTCLDPALCAEGPMPATNNRIEGGVNSQLREVLRSHRGLTKLKRVKAVFWWCYLHVECPKTMADTLREMPTDADVDLLRERYGMRAEDASRPEKWGEGLVWEEFHHKTRYPFRNE